MWRYFSKINIDALVEITKRRRATASENNINSGGDKDDTTTHTFADIRKRWGNHRKSIKNRMKRFYAKDATIAKENRCCSSLSDDDLGSQAASCSTASTDSTRSMTEHFTDEMGSILNEIDKKYRKKENNIFGSLGRLRKSRTSLCVEEVSPRKKVAASLSTTSSTSSSVNTNGKIKQPDFQNELRKEMKRRCASDSKVINF